MTALAEGGANRSGVGKVRKDLEGPRLLSIRSSRAKFLSYSSGSRGSRQTVVVPPPLPQCHRDWETKESPTLQNVTQVARGWAVI